MSVSSEVAHIEQVYASAQQQSAAASSSIVASWRRCITMHHLAPEEARAPERLTEAEFHQARERAAPLLAEAADEIDRLFSTVGKAGCCLILTDRDGVALERRGIVSEDKEFHRLGLWPGALWSEASVGTNGIGTAIAEDRPLAIFRDQHFLSSNIRLSCTSAPIRDHTGQLAAALDISTCRQDVHEVSLSILSQAVRDAALRIELNLFRAAFPGARFVMVPSAINPASAFLAVDKDDLILGATRGARLALKLDDRVLRAGMAAADALQENRRQDSSDDLADAERAALRRAMARTGGNVSQAAELLGISRATMHRKMKKLDVS